MKKNSYWQHQIKLFSDILDDYEDIEIEIEDSLQSYDMLMTDIESAVGEINDELERLQGELARCRKKRLKLCSPADLLYLMETLDEQQELSIEMSTKSSPQGISD